VLAARIKVDRGKNRDFLPRFGLDKSVLPRKYYDMTNLLLFIRNDADMLRLVRETAQRSETIYLSQHAKDRMLERGINRHQVEYCLQNGVIDEPAHKNTKGN